MPTASEPTAAKRTLTGLALVAILLAAVVLQLTVVNRLPLPAAYPDLVLLAVTAIAVCTSPLPGTLAGFAGGLALDVAPPASHYAGEYALVFCLAGYGAARAVRAIYDLTGERDPLTMFTVMAVAAAAGEAGKAALGMLLSDPDVTGPAIKQVLPAAILYDLLLAPLMFLLVARLTRDADAERAPAPEFSYAQRLASVFRAASYGAAPDLRLSGTGANYRAPVAPRRVPRLRLAGTGDDHRSPSLPRSVPPLRLSRGGAGSIGRTGSAASPGAAIRPAGAGSPSLNFAADRPARTVRRTVRGPGKNWLRAGAPAAAAPRLASRATPRAEPRAGSFRRVQASRTPAYRAGAVPRAGSFRGASALRTPAYRAGRAPRIPGHGWLRPAGLGGARSAASIAGAAPRSGADVLAARSAPSGLSAWAGAVTPLARRAPRSGWLHSASPSWARSTGPRLAPRRGWLGGTSRPRTVIGSTPGAGPRRGNWYTAAPSRDWVRHSRHPWRKRRQRLLRMVGVGR
ncbi:rod shape-determining protein MreD [Trebonia kvetii]|uniref:Rod shape-determining protein MreD n=1 Tax=Trebonia kvetii TaxID=2480626 RepID=A0A6P2BVA0_9ACTN|nr:rod shape-determining protein MreD [Trebonia kvetii]TVZ02820.1 rod shape-determining protein MreD [Trebonia kvetii]